MSPRKHRVERALTDHGYGPGWVVLDPDGRSVAEALTFEQAITDAELLAYIDRAAEANRAAAEALNDDIEQHIIEHIGALA